MIKIGKTREIVIGFIILAFIFFNYSDQIVSYVSSLNPILILFLTVFLNPIYILFIYKMYQDYGIKGATGGLLISLGVDILSLPHIFTKQGVLSEDSYKLVTDTNFWNLIPDFLKFNITLPFLGNINFAVLLLYIGVTTGLIILALMITHKKKFKEIFMKSI